jgi:hypothetical protein
VGRILQRAVGRRLGAARGGGARRGRPRGGSARAPRRAPARADDGSPAALLARGAQGLARGSLLLLGAAWTAGLAVPGGEDARAAAGARGAAEAGGAQRARLFWGLALLHLLCAGARGCFALPALRACAAQWTRLASFAAAHRGSAARGRRRAGMVGALELLQTFLRAYRDAEDASARAAAAHGAALLEPPLFVLAVLIAAPAAPPAALAALALAPIAAWLVGPGPARPPAPARGRLSGGGRQRWTWPGRSRAGCSRSATTSSSSTPRASRSPSPDLRSAHPPAAPPSARRRAARPVG